MQDGSQPNSARQAEEALLRRYVIDRDNLGHTDDEQLGTSKEDGSRVVIKRVSKQNTDRASDVRHAISMHVLSETTEPGLIQMHEWLESEFNIWLVVDHIPGGTLGQHIASRGSLAPNRTKGMLNQLLSGIAFLLLNRIAHLRICDQTLYLDANGDLVIGDLAFAFEYCGESEVQITSLIEGRYGDDIYVAPEAYGSDSYNARKAVVWSCGVVLYLMTTGGTDRLSNLEHPVYLGAPLPRRRFSISSTVPNILTYPNRLKVPEYARQIMSKMLQIDPRSRAELIEVAARVPKQLAGEKLRPLMEICWLDYKRHVSPEATSLSSLQLGDQAYASSMFSTDTNTGLLGQRNRLMSTGW